MMKNPNLPSNSISVHALTPGTVTTKGTVARVFFPSDVRGYVRMTDGSMVWVAPGGTMRLA